MRTRPTRNLLIALGGTLLVVFAGLGPTHAGPFVPKGSDLSAPGPTAAWVQPFVSLTSHSNLYVNASAPSAALPPGEEFAAAYAVQVPGYTPALGPATVRIPNAVVQIPTTTGAMHLYLTQVNLSVTSTAVVTGAAGPLTRFGSPLAFNASAIAFLSTQGIAVTASWPYAGPAVQFRWHWTMTAPDGNTSSGPWSAWTSVVPGQLADIAIPISHVWTIGQAYEMCFSGPVGGRTFSIHLATSTPVQQLDGGAATVPVGGPTPYCWNSTLPTQVAPQSAFIHLWEYGNVTFLIYVIQVNLVTESSGGGAGGAGDDAGAIPPVTWLIVAVGSVIVVIIAIEGLLLARSARRRRDAASRGPPEAMGSLPPPVLPEEAARPLPRDDADRAGFSRG